MEYTLGIPVKVDGGIIFPEIFQEVGNIPVKVESA
jgi:hypothetical protein